MHYFFVQCSCICISPCRSLNTVGAVHFHVYFSVDFLVTASQDALTDILHYISLLCLMYLLCYVCRVYFQVALLSGVKGLTSFIKDPTVGLAGVMDTQLSFLSNENEVKSQLRKARVEFDGPPTVSIPKLHSLINPSYDFIQVLVSPTILMSFCCCCECVLSGLQLRH